MQTAEPDTLEPARQALGPRRLGHANLFVTDWEKSAAFYADVAGLEEVYRRPKVMAAFLSNGNTHHDIAVMGLSGPAGRGLPPGLNHLGFELEHQAALVAAYKHAAAAGVAAYTEDHDVARGLYLTDPDGNQIEVYADTVKDWRTQRHGTIMADSPTWSLDNTAEIRDILYHENPQIRRVEHAMFHPARTAGVAVVVSAANYQASLDFYRDYALLNILWQDAERGIAVFGGQLGERSLIVLRANDVRAPGLHHVGFEVADAEDLNNSIAAARQAGIETFAELRRDSRHSVCIHDPDGTVLQFYSGTGLPFAALSDAGDDELPYLI
ncbi:MAG: VOC family protein [Proteobacteria bacterium]|nr:VOC family protein [Pseudomonadota bacterium]